jgi:dienelactone hydrolase
VGIELLDFDVGSETYEGRLTVQDEDADEGVVMLPGAGHGPFGDIFDIAAYELAGDGKRVFRVETWETREELEAKTLGELHDEVDAAVDYLRSNGCSTVHVIAKSFGGGIALSHVPDAVDGLLLWAPAVETGVDASAATDPDEAIGEGENLLIGIESLSVDVPVRILVGDEDRGVSVEDCRRIADAVDDGDVTVIPGENHSFNENRTAVVEQTLRYLSTES